MNERFTTGDRVIIRDVLFPSRRPFVGREAVVQRDNGDSYVVSVGGEPLIFATDVTSAPTTEPDTESLLDLRRLQAATFAHQLLGADASLDELIGVAEFALGERTLGTETTGAIPAYTHRDHVHVAARDTVAELARAREITKGFKRFGNLDVFLDRTPGDDDVAGIATGDGGDSYVNADQAADLIEFLQAAIVIREADAGDSSPV